MVLATSSPVPGASQPPQDCRPEPLLLPRDLRLTPEQFALVCQANPEAVLELAADGSLIVMTPTGGETSSRNSFLMIQLGLALQRSGAQFRLFDSSGGFRLPDDSILSPDAALVAEERWQSLTPEQRRGFPPLCPDLVVELVSPSDEGPRGLTALRRKMAAYQLQRRPVLLAAVAPGAGRRDLACRSRGHGRAAGEPHPAGGWGILRWPDAGTGADLEPLNPLPIPL